MAKTARSSLGAQLYTLRDFLKTPADVAPTLVRVRKIGYENVQVSGVGPMDQKELRKMLDDAGVKAVGHHTGLKECHEEFRGLVEKLHTLGSRYTAIAWVNRANYPTAEAWKKLAQEMNELGRQFQAEGITLQYHNHAFEFHRYDGRTALEILYAESDPRFLQAEIDTHWVARGGGEPSAWCRAMKGRMGQVHFKDMVMLNDQPAMAEIGEGNLNWPAILKACKAAGVRDYLVEQDTCPVTNDPFKSLEISFNNLRKMGLR